MLAPIDTLKNLYQISFFIKELVTTKKPNKCKRVTHPSILSKLLQILFNGLTPTISAKPITATKTADNTRTKEFLGLYLAFNKARIAHKPTIISTRILNVKAFPVIKGKNVLLKTIKGIKGTKKIAP